MDEGTRTPDAILCTEWFLLFSKWNKPLHEIVYLAPICIDLTVCLFYSFPGWMLSQDRYIVYESPTPLKKADSSHQ